MSLQTIAAPLAHTATRLDSSDKPSVSTTLKMIYEGGSLDGKAANFPTRDVSCIVVGSHRGNLHFFETYQRTIWLNIRNRRTIFRYAGVTVKSSNSSRWKSLFAALHLRRREAVIV